MLSEVLKQYLNNYHSNSDKNSILLLLVKLRENLEWETVIDDETISKLTRDGIIARDYITSKFILKIPVYNTDNESFEQSIKIVEDFEDRINQYRYLFKNYRIGNMGNKRNCIELLHRFLVSNNYTFDDVLTAAQYYVQNTDPQFIMNAENFIYKMTDKGWVSKLADTLEELDFDRESSNML